MVYTYLLGTTQLLKPYDQVGRCHSYFLFTIGPHWVLAFCYSSCQNPSFTKIRPQGKYKKVIC